MSEDTRSTAQWIRIIISKAYEAIAKTYRPRLPGKPYLSGNYAPVHDELLTENLEVVLGKLPDGLDGCFVRAGPNPFFKPLAGYHWFDGDGMLHLVRIKDGRANYCNRFVKTERLEHEREAGRPLYTRFGDLFGLRGVGVLALHNFAVALGVWCHKRGAGTANTALVYHAGRLLALHEGDLPYAVRVLCNGLIETMGKMRLDKSNWKTTFTAHPKLDSKNGDLLFIGYNFLVKPYVSAGIMDKYGNLVRQWGIELPYPVMMHDMAATENYIVVLHMPLCFDPEAMVKQCTVPFRLRKELPSRIGLLRRDLPSCPEGGAEVSWFTLPGPGAMVFHVANSWEDEQGNVKVFACHQDNLNLDLDTMKGEELAHLHEYTLCPSDGSATSRRISEVIGDFPVVHPDKTTRPCKWTWMGVMDPNSCTPSFTGIAKLDLLAPAGKDACVAQIDYPAGTYGGEAVFVPRTGSQDEDDGYLCVYVHDSFTDVSYMNIYDGRTMAATPVTSLRMPRRVPYGFHGAWVTEEQLRKQVMWV